MLPSLRSAPDAGTEDPYVVRALKRVTLAHVWTAVLSAGALVVIAYAAGVGFMPELDFQASATVLATCAVTGLVLALVLVVLLLVPALLWKSTAEENELLKPLWGEPPTQAAWLTLGFALPVVIALMWGAGTLWYSSLKDWRFAALALIPVGVIAARARQVRDKGQDRFWTIVTRVALYTLLSGAVVVEFAIPMLVVVGLLRLSPTTDREALQLLLFAMSVLLAGNIAAVALRTKRAYLDAWLGIACAVLMLVLTATQSWTFIPRRIMQVYALGDVRRVKLVLDRQGCGIARQLGGVVTAAPPDSMCTLSGVDVTMRLGSQFVIALPRARDTTQFVLPKEHVLSWTLPAAAPPEAHADPSRGSGV